MTRACQSYLLYLLRFCSYTASGCNEITVPCMCSDDVVMTTVMQILLTVTRVLINLTFGNDAVCSVMTSSSSSQCSIQDIVNNLALCISFEDLSHESSSSSSLFRSNSSPFLSLDSLFDLTVSSLVLLINILQRSSPARMSFFSYSKYRIICV